MIVSLGLLLLIAVASVADDASDVVKNYVYAYEDAEARANLGFAIGALWKDYDGDNRTEVMIGSPTYGTFDAGALYIYSFDRDDPATKNSLISLINAADVNLDASSYPQFGRAVACLSGFGSSTGYIAVSSDGEAGEATASFKSGAVHLITLSSSAEVADFTTLNGSTYNVTGASDTTDDDGFGVSIAAAQDWNGDGSIDLLVGAPGLNGGGKRAAVLLFLLTTSNGRIGLLQGAQKNPMRIDAESAGVASTAAGFGRAVEYVGRVGSEGHKTILIGAPDTSSGTGAVYIAAVHRNFSIVSTTRIGGDTGEQLPLDGSYQFGASIAYLGNGTVGLSGTTAYDDDDSSITVAVGAPDYSSSGSGAVFLLVVNVSSGYVSMAWKIKQFDGVPWRFDLSYISSLVGTGDLFGYDVANLGRFDSDSTVDLAVGMPRWRSGTGSNIPTRGGAFMLLYLQESPTPAPSATPTTPAPSIQPSPRPSLSLLPTANPTNSPTFQPAPSPSIAPTLAPSKTPSLEPSPAPSLQPSIMPSSIPTLFPTAVPTSAPTASS